MKDTSDIGIVYRYMKEYNYSALWKDNITTRFFADWKRKGKRYIELPPDQSEFYDISLGTYCREGCDFCFLEDSLVETLTGKKKIKDITTNDKVYSFNHTSNRIELNSVDQVYVRDYDGEILSIELDNGITIECTPEHRLYTKNRGYVPAKDLKEDDEILEYNKQCIFCGKDISSLRSNAIICGDRKCINKYNIWKKENKSSRFCEICGTPIDDLPGQRKICRNEECIKEQKRRKYNSSMIQKTCQSCGNTFWGTGKKTLCIECYKNKKKELLDDNLITYAQIILCKKCKRPIDVESRVVFNGSPILRQKIGKHVCEVCKINSRKQLSIRMKTDNPSFNKNFLRKIHRRNFIKKLWVSMKSHKNIYYLLKHNKKITLYDILFERGLIKNSKGKILYTYPLKKEKRVSFRMKIMNPMKNKRTVDKVKATLLNEYSSGVLKRIRGVNHWLWKGNRNFNKAVRIELRSWVKSMFKMHNYTCQLCGATNSILHVHHKIPLRDIISKTLIENNITIEYINSIEGTDEYFEIINKIVRIHNDKMDEVGIVVCPSCHEKIDSFYRRKKHEN